MPAPSIATRSTLVSVCHMISLETAKARHSDAVEHKSFNRKPQASASEYAHYAPWADCDAVGRRARLRLAGKRSAGKRSAPSPLYLGGEGTQNPNRARSESSSGVSGSEVGTVAAPFRHAGFADSARRGVGCAESSSPTIFSGKKLVGLEDSAHPAPFLGKTGQFPDAGFAYSARRLASCAAQGRRSNWHPDPRMGAGRDDWRLVEFI